MVRLFSVSYGLRPASLHCGLVGTHLEGAMTEILGV